MSVQSDVHNFLATIAKGATNGDYIPMDPGRVAEQVGTTRNKVNKTLFNLTQGNKIELQRGQNGRSITGFRLLAEPTLPRPRALKKEGRPRLERPVVLMPDQPRRRRGLPTPHLDEYALSKEKFARLRDELGPFIEAEFKENPYAEEGLMLRERLAHIEDNYSETFRRNEELERDLRYLRGRVNREQAESVAKVTAPDAD